MLDNQTLLFLIHIRTIGVGIIGVGIIGICWELLSLDGIIGLLCGIKTIGGTDNLPGFICMIMVKEIPLEVKNQLLVLVFKQLQINKLVVFIAEYNSTFKRDNSTFFPYGTITQVDFPMVDDFVEQRSFYVGVGKRIKRTGVHMMIGSVTEDVKWRGKDNIGYITFPKYVDRFTTVKVGALHDYKNFTIKLDYDPILNNGTFGLGVNF
jgi:hypothetical protein